MHVQNETAQQLKLATVPSSDFALPHKILPSLTQVNTPSSAGHSCRPLVVLPSKKNTGSLLHEMGHVDSEEWDRDPLRGNTIRDLRNEHSGNPNLRVATMCYKVLSNHSHSRASIHNVVASEVHHKERIGSNGGCLQQTFLYPNEKQETILTSERVFTRLDFLKEIFNDNHLLCSKYLPHLSPSGQALSRVRAWHNRWPRKAWCRERPFPHSHWDKRP